MKLGGGSVMLWGCMLWDRPGYACRIDGRMDGDLFIQILDEELQESLAHYSKSPQDIIVRVSYLLSQDCTEVNLYGIAAKYVVMVVDKKSCCWELRCSSHGLTIQWVHMGVDPLLCMCT